VVQDFSTSTVSSTFTLSTYHLINHTMKKTVRHPKKEHSSHLFLKHVYLKGSQLEKLTIPAIETFLQDAVTFPGVTYELNYLRKIFERQIFTPLAQMIQSKNSCTSKSASTRGI